MTAKYFAILTNYGAAQLANAVALGTQMNISAMAVGDGGGTLPVPDPAQTKLVRETRRAAVNQVSIDEKNPNFIIAEQVIPENEGGWWIREIGLFDDTGGLIAVGNAPETYKPNLQEGSGRTQVIQMVLMVSSTQAITLKVDPSVVLATREYVTKSIDAAIQESETKAARIYATKTELSSGLSGKQPTGDYATRTELNDALSGKQPTGDYATKTEVNSKLAKDQNGADIPNKDTFIKNLGLPEKYQPKGNYQPAGNYADKSSSVLQEFNGGVRAPYIDAITGEDRTGFRVIGQQAVIYSVINGKIYQIFIPLRTGSAVLSDELPKLPLIGSGSTRGGVTSERQLGVTYINDKPYSIMVTVMLQSTVTEYNLITSMKINNLPASDFYVGVSGQGSGIFAKATHSQLVLPRESYVVTSATQGAKIMSWVEIAA
ncbi:phage tail protein [Morganella morganii]|uniref:phage tail protein n=1 Tax=Morganella morganii TaxID=582 RepID=UPI0032DB379C